MSLCSTTFLILKMCLQVQTQRFSLHQFTDSLLFTTQLHNTTHAHFVCSILLSILSVMFPVYPPDEQTAFPVKEFVKHVSELHDTRGFQQEFEVQKCFVHFLKSKKNEDSNWGFFANYIS